jgi:type I restriction enzyme S subunit
MTAQNKNIPTLRFKQFEDKWSTSKLGNLGSFKNGLNKESKDFGFGSPFVNLMDVFGKTILEETDFGLVNATEKDIEVYSLKKGDVLFIRSSVKRSGVGETILVAKDLANTVYSGFLIRFRDNNKELDLNFKSYCFSNTPFRNELLSYATSSANTNINQESLSQIRLHFPTLPEQQKIASFLSAIDEKIQRLTRKKELLEQYKKGVMQQLFCLHYDSYDSGDNHDDQFNQGNQKNHSKSQFRPLRFKDENGKAYPKWEEKRLGDVAVINMGQSPDSNSYNNQSIGMLLIQGNADISGRVTNPRQWTSKPTKKCEIGDLILTVRAPVGSISKSLHNACIGRGVCSIKNNMASNIEYLYQFLLDYEDKWKRIEQGSTFTAVNGDDIKSIRLKVPSLEEQQKIASYLSSLDTKIESVATQIAQIQTFKKGLLQQMFV